MQASARTKRVGAVCSPMSSQVRCTITCDTRASLLSRSCHGREYWPAGGSGSVTGMTDGRMIGIRSRRLGVGIGSTTSTGPPMEPSPGRSIVTDGERYPLNVLGSEVPGLSIAVTIGTTELSHCASRSRSMYNIIPRAWIACAHASAARPAPRRSASWRSWPAREAPWQS